MRECGKCHGKCYDEGGYECWECGGYGGVPDEPAPAPEPEPESEKDS